MPKNDFYLSLEGKRTGLSKGQVLVLRKGKKPLTDAKLGSLLGLRWKNILGGLKSKGLVARGKAGWARTEKGARALLALAETYLENNLKNSKEKKEKKGKSKQNGRKN